MLSVHKRMEAITLKSFLSLDMQKRTCYVRCRENTETKSKTHKKRENQIGEEPIKENSENKLVDIIHARRTSSLGIVECIARRSWLALNGRHMENQQKLKKKKRIYQHKKNREE